MNWYPDYLPHPMLMKIRLLGEIWRPIKNYESLYYISNLGRVVSVPRIGKRFISYGPNLSPKRKNFRLFVFPGKVLNLNQNDAGYFYVVLSKFGKTKGMLVARLVAQAFLPNPEQKKTVDHLDGNTTNNHVTNLRWATQKEQSETQRRLGTLLVGSQRPSAKLTEENIPVVFKLKRIGWSAKRIGNWFGVTSDNIRAILHRKTWRHVLINSEPKVKGADREAMEEASKSSIRKRAKLSR